VALLLTGVALLQPSRALADNNARDYIPAPAGVLAVLTYYQHVSANNFYLRGSKASTNIGLTENIGILRPIYFVDIPMPWGLSPMRAAPQILIPFGEASLNGNVNPAPIGGTPGTGTESSGFGTPILLSQFWFLHDDQTKTYLAFSPFFFFKSGAYNNWKQVVPGGINIGNHRWAFRQEFNATKGFEVIPGHFGYFEVTLGVDEFTDNDDYGAASAKLSQRPTFNVESHLSYDITKTVFASVDFYGHYGGNYWASKNGILLENVGAVGQSALGMSLAYSFAPGFQLMLQYRGDVAVANGPAANIFLARFLWATDLNSLMGNPQAKP
jgi:hypothetical protein